jgi:peptidoglycan/LPS O-acetylase OafA/YrhL
MEFPAAEALPPTRPAARPKHPAEGSPYRTHLPALDGIRGLAILLVMFSHIVTGDPQNNLQRVVMHLFGLGANGVDLFFVLSGFLITGILYDSLHDPAFFRKFYARRVLRIFPLYYGVLLAMFATHLFLGKNYHGQLLSFALYLQNTWLVAVPIWAYHYGSHIPLSHFWSLAVEEQFYMFWPLAVFLLRSRRRIFTVSIAVALVVPIMRFLLLAHGVPFKQVNVMTVCRLDSLLGGAALAILVRSRAHQRVLRLAPWIFILGASVELILLVVGSFYTAPLFIAFGTSLSYSALAVGFAGLIAWCLQPTSRVNRLFSVTPMRALGKYSYGMYVYHVILLEMLGQLFESPFISLAPHFKAVDALVARLLLLLLAFAVAFASFHLYETPFLKLKRFFDYRRTAEPA